MSLNISNEAAQVRITELEQRLAEAEARLKEPEACCAATRDAVEQWSRDYERALNDAEVDEKRYAAVNDLYGKNFHQGVRSGLVKCDIALTKLKKVLSPEYFKDFHGTEEWLQLEAQLKESEACCAVMREALEYFHGHKHKDPLHQFETLGKLVDVALSPTAGKQLLERLERAEKALSRIINYPVHSEPVGGAYAMQDIATEALKAKE